MGKLGDTLKSVFDNAQGRNGQGSAQPMPLPSPSPNDTQTPVSGDPLANLYGGSDSGLMALMPQAPQAMGQTVPQGVNPAAMQDNPYGLNVPNTPQDLSAPDQSTPPPDQTGADATVVGDRFQPKHETVLQQIGDYFLGGAFKRKVYNQNLRDAMHNFQDDPQSAIRRVDSFDPATAWRMSQQYDATHGDDAYKAERQTFVQQEVEDRAMGHASSMMGAIQNSTDPEAAFQKLGPVIQSYLKNHNIDTSTFPDTYDPDKINAFMLNSVPTKDQMSINNLNDYRKERLGQLGTSISNTQSYREQRLQQLQGGMTERQRHDQVMEGKGMPQPGMRELSPDRTVMREFRSDGQWHIFKKVNGQIKEVGVLAPKNVGGTKYDPSAYSDTPDDEEDQ